MSVNQDHVRIAEALLFASAEPLSTKVLHERMPEGADVGGALMQLKTQYEGRGISLIELDGNWAFRTASDLGDKLQIEREVQRKLSRAAMETLAIIAYHQPVTRAEVENIRGVVTHKGTLDALMEMAWIKPGKRRETPGRPLTWVTTTEFLDHFSLESITALPGLEDLKASGLLDRRPAIDALPEPDLFEAMAAADADNDDSEDDDAYDDIDDEDDEDEAEDVAAEQTEGGEQRDDAEDAEDDENFADFL